MAQEPKTTADLEGCTCEPEPDSWSDDEQAYLESVEESKRIHAMPDKPSASKDSPRWVSIAFYGTVAAIWIAVIVAISTNAIAQDYPPLEEVVPPTVEREGAGIIAVTGADYARTIPPTDVIEGTPIMFANLGVPDAASDRIVFAVNPSTEYTVESIVFYHLDPLDPDSFDGALYSDSIGVSRQDKIQEYLALNIRINQLTQELGTITHQEAMEAVRRYLNEREQDGQANGSRQEAVARDTRDDQGDDGAGEILIHDSKPPAGGD